MINGHLGLSSAILVSNEEHTSYFYKREADRGVKIRLGNYLNRDIYEYKGSLKFHRSTRHYIFNLIVKA